MMDRFEFFESLQRSGFIDFRVAEIITLPNAGVDKDHILTRLRHELGHGLLECAYYSTTQEFSREFCGDATRHRLVQGVLSPTYWRMYTELMRQTH